MKKIALISCTSKKDKASKYVPVKASELYTSALFVKAWKYAKDVLKVDEIYILSAKHHLLDPGTKVMYYNESLVGKSVKDIKNWSDIVKGQMKQAEFDFNNDEFIILAGKNYHKYLIDSDFKNVVYPYAKCKGIGYILQYLNKQIEI